MVVGDDDLRPLDVVEHVAGHEFAAVVVAVGIVRLEDPQAIFDREAGRDDEKAAREVLTARRRTALIVCQAMSMAMTVVLPAPVASFSARRISSGLASLFAAARWSRMLLPAVECGATSVSQMAVSTASTWQKNGRISLNL